MGRPKGSKNRTPGIGDNSEPAELTDAQRKSLLFEAADKIAPLKGQAAGIAWEIRTVYKAYKVDGIPKKDIDFLLQLQDKESDEAREGAARYLQIFTWAHPGVQAELFDEIREAAE